MRNLKRVLSLALALVMVLGMMVITTSAAKFDDAEEITLTEAADVLSAIGVITGDNGNFAPNRALTREEGAAFICYMVMGKEAADKLPGSGNFADVKTDRWSAGEIDYCANLEYIKGYTNAAGEQVFNPKGELTAVAFGRMLLGALGYDGDIEGYTGPNWSTNIAADMIDIGLDVEGVAMDATLTREQAAQMALQALECDVVKYANKGTAITIDGVEVVVGASSAEPVAASVRDSYNNDVEDDTLQMIEKYFPTVSKVATIDAMGRPAHEWMLKNSPIGLYADEADYTAFVTVKENNLEKVVDKISKRFKDGAATIYVNGEEDNTYTGARGDIVEIYMDGYDATKVDTIVVTHKTVSKITGPVVLTTAKDVTYIDVPGVVTAGLANKVVGYENLKPQDVVMYYTDADGITYIEVAESFDGVMTETTEDDKTGSTNDPATYTIAGEKYSRSAQTRTISQTDLTSYEGLDGATYWVDNAGYIIAAKGPYVPVELMMVMQNDTYEAGDLFGGAKQQSQVLFVDETGAVEIVKIASVGKLTLVDDSYRPFDAAKHVKVGTLNGKSLEWDGEANAWINNGDTDKDESSDSGFRNAKFFSYVETPKGYALTEKTTIQGFTNIVNGLATTFTGAYGDTVYTTNSDTIYLVRDIYNYAGYKAGNTYEDSFTVYNGYKEVPTITSAHCIAYINRDGVAEYVVVDQYGTIANTADELFYAISDDVTAVYKTNSNKVEYYYITGIYNGQIVNMKLNATAAATVGTNFTNKLFNITKYDADGYVDTIVALTSVTGKYWPGMEGTVAADKDVLLMDTKNSTKAFSYTDSTIVYTVSPEGILSVGTVANIATDGNDLVTVVSKGGTLGAATNREAAVVYIQKKVPTAPEYTLTMAPGSTFGWKYSKNNAAAVTVSAVSANVSVSASDVVTLIAYSNGSKTWPIANVTGTNCTIVNNGDGTWTIKNVSAATTVTVTVGAAVAAPTVAVTADTYTVNLTGNSASAAATINEIIAQLMAAGYARNEITVTYGSGTYAVSTTQNGVTINWNVTP